MNNHYLKENSHLQINFKDFTIYLIPLDLEVQKIIIKTYDSTRSLGYIFNDKANNQFSNFKVNDQAVCFYKNIKGEKVIDRIFYVPTMVYIKETEDNLKEIFKSLFGYYLNSENNLTKKLIKR